MSLSQASGEISLDPEREIVIYMKNTGGITASNAPSQATITVFTYNDVYEKEALVTALIPDFSFMGTEQMTYTNYVWAANNAHMNFTVRNTGSSDLSIQAVRVDGNTPTGLSPALTTPYLLAKGSSVTFMVTHSFSSGIQYEFTTITSKGNIFGPLIKTAPQSQQAYVFLNRDAVSWPTNAAIKLYLRNTGTLDAFIDSVYIGTSASNLERQTSLTYDPPNGAVAAYGGMVSVTIGYSWSTGTTYYFRVVLKVGPPLEFNIRAP